ncbi:hypothetical protein [Deinococcus cellulosilyticus]|uniref:Uncharacterized protein n=1 Tax=Deinococcus cellulosilyticus (strain DSM 18568 / NBRC 106333 / KACC 11606 / 5516J-15) TaxID=1223518 RepID=A0A511N0I1_DEIC1|nr:hypothetical protein [Deinococcus cellulosilyticus]GEM46362.1 hypothetical protein DC3_19970 [Deinococcus cellulosilyticus NBRC 106333 = KACC 11606]
MNFFRHVMRPVLLVSMLSSGAHAQYPAVSSSNLKFFNKICDPTVMVMPEPYVHDEAREKTIKTYIRSALNKAKIPIIEEGKCSDNDLRLYATIMLMDVKVLGKDGVRYFVYLSAAPMKYKGLDEPLIFQHGREEIAVNTSFAFKEAELFLKGTTDMIFIPVWKDLHR